MASDNVGRLPAAVTNIYFAMCEFRNGNTSDNKLEKM